jgi:tetratricopeptide (TPR) repeat protein
VLLFCAVSSCSPGGTEETARARGDLAYARDSLELALAEYRLAVNQGDETGWSLARVAHTYARLGRVNEAAEFYARAVRADSAMADQAAADLLHLAREAADRDDRFLMASAIEAALSFRPGLGLQSMALPLAHHHFENGQYGRSLPFFLKAMAESGDSMPDLVFEVGQVYEEIGDCEQALVHFERYREMVDRRSRTQVDWFIGSCSYRLGSELRVAATDSADISGDLDRVGLERGLAFVDRTLELGQPRNLMGQALLERGEILSLLGRCDEALEAFEEVLRVEPSETTSTARRASQRFDEVKFGRGLENLMPRRGCG